MKAMDIGRAVFPDATDDWLGYAIWNHTGYPSFWNPGNPVKQMYRQLHKLKRVLANGDRPCNFCTSPLEDDDQWECKKCRAALTTGRREGWC